MVHLLLCICSMGGCVVNSYILTELTRRVQKRIEQHIEALNSPDAEISARAGDTLIRYYGVRALEPLIAACDHSNPIVRFRAAWALGCSQDPRAFDTILRLTRDPVGEVRYDAAIALGILGDERGIEPLIALMSVPDVDSGVDSAAAMGLTRMGRLPIPALLSLLQGATTEVRMMAASVLGHIGGEAEIERLATLLTDPDEHIRIAGIEALAELGTQRCLEVIEGCLKDVSAPVRKNADYWHQDLTKALSRQQKKAKMALAQG